MDKPTLIELLKQILEQPPYRSGYSVYDGGFQDGINSVIKLIKEFLK